MSDNNQKTYILEESQLLLKGAQLKNTDWALAICIYTGIETKIMLNSQQGRQKLSHLDLYINKLVIFICIVEAVICTFMAIYGRRWLVNSSFDDLVAVSIYTENQLTIYAFFTYFLLLNTLLPLSLPVCIEVCKFWQTYYINNDPLMFSWERLQLPEVKNSILLEELG